MSLSTHNDSERNVEQARSQPSQSISEVVGISGENDGVSYEGLDTTQGSTLMDLDDTVHETLQPVGPSPAPEILIPTLSRHLSSLETQDSASSTSPLTTISPTTTSPANNSTTTTSQTATTSPTTTTSATVTSSMPATDKAGAASTFADKKWLSATAINYVLDVFQTEGFRSIDNTIVDPTPSNLSSKRIRVGPHEHTAAQLLLVASHWSVGIIDLKTGAVEHLDSRRSDSSPGIPPAIRDALSRSTGLLSQNEHLRDLQWTYSSKVCARATFPTQR